MEIKAVHLVNMGNVKLSLIPSKEVVVIAPMETTPKEVTLLAQRGTEICAYLKDRTKEFQGNVTRSGTIVVQEKVSKPTEVILFNWRNGVMIASRKPYEERKQNAASHR